MLPESTVAGSTTEGNDVRVNMVEDIGNNVGDDVGDNYGSIIDTDDGGFNGKRWLGLQWRMTTTVTTMPGGVFQ
jgi:hypothetical protein